MFLPLSWQTESSMTFCKKALRSSSLQGNVNQTKLCLDYIVYL